MTKEELKLEAIRYLENFKDCANCKNRWGDCADQLDEYCLINGCCFATPKEQDIYLAGAEPREKRIEELKKENAELTQENEEMKKGLGCETCQIHLEYMRLNNRIADLENENAELKKENKVLAQNLEDTEILNKTYEKRFDDLEKENTELKKLKRECETSLCRAEYQYNYEQLAKAKDILRRLMENQPTPSSMYEEADLVGWREVNKEAEQFLKDCEVEK